MFLRPNGVYLELPDAQLAGWSGRGLGSKKSVGCDCHVAGQKSESGAGLLALFLATPFAVALRRRRGT
jgi:hypothetical protein